MSRSSFSKAYKEIANLNSMEMTFTIEDADLDKLHDVLKDINVRECPWFEVQDKHGNKAKYYREPQWIPCSERYPEQDERVLVTIGDYDWFVWNCMSNRGDDYFWEDEQGLYHNKYEVLAWMPLPEPYGGEQE